MTQTSLRSSMEDAAAQMRARVLHGQTILEATDLKYLSPEVLSEIDRASGEKRQQLLEAAKAAAATAYAPLEADVNEQFDFGITGG